jgi:hypothetical protein
LAGNGVAILIPRRWARRRSRRLERRRPNCRWLHPPAFAHPVPFHQMGDPLYAPRGRHNFFPKRSFRTTLSSIVSASIRLSLAFSSREQMTLVKAHAISTLAPASPIPGWCLACASDSVVSLLTAARLAPLTVPYALRNDHMREAIRGIEAPRCFGEKVRQPFDHRRADLLLP